MNEQFKTMHLFAGAGGGILADLILGHQPVVAVEWDKYACNVLRERAADGWFDGLDVWEGDVREFTAHDWQGRVDCIHAGFPCQDISVAGSQAGVGEDTRSGLYREVLRIADEVRPEYIFLENVAAIVTGDDGAMLRTVAGDIASRGYDAAWLCLSAAEVGANHQRDRWWMLAYPKSEQCNGSEHQTKNSSTSSSESGNSSGSTDVGYPNNDGSSATKIREGSQEGDGDNPSREKQTSQSQGSSKQHEDVGYSNGASSKRGRLSCGVHQINESDSGCTSEYWQSGWWEVEPDVGRVAHGIPSASHRLKALGNAQVPLQCAAAFSMLWEIAFDAGEKAN